MTITGLGTFVPDTVVTNDDLAQVLDTNDEWIRQRTGIRARRLAAPGLSSSDLGIPAGRAALADAGIAPEQVDLVITASISPDQIMPATASRVAYLLGCVNAGTFDVLAGCTGFVYALAMATGAVASGLQENVLVVGAEAISRIIDQQDRSTAILFGDGAGAVVVSPLVGSAGAQVADAAGAVGAAAGGPAATVRQRAPRGILGFDLGNDGEGGQYLAVPAGGSRMPASSETIAQRMHYMKMNGPEVYKFATRVVARSAGRVLERCGRTVDEIDLFVPHQANLRIIEHAAKRLGLAEDRVYTNLQRYGNTSCASIPLCLAEARAEGRIKPGDLLLLMGFGAGLTWGACLIEWTQGARSGDEAGAADAAGAAPESRPSGPGGPEAAGPGAAAAPGGGSL